MGMCLNKKVIAGLVAVGVGVVLFAPSAIGAALPLLFLAVCPLSMIFMMRAMPNGGGSGSMGGKQQPQTAAMDEVAALRAEVQHLRTERDRREATTNPDDLAGVGKAEGMMEKCSSMGPVVGGGRRR